METDIRLADDKNSITIKDTICDKKALAKIKEAEDKEQINALKRCLSNDEKELLRMWESGMKQNDIANVLGRTQPLVSRKLKKIFEKMRRSEECLNRATK